MSVLVEVLLVLVVEDSRGEIGEIKVHLPISHHKGARFFLDVHSYLFPNCFIIRIVMGNSKFNDSKFQRMVTKCESAADNTPNFSHGQLQSSDQNIWVCLMKP